jgi:putative tryptophan/tyrosine transport system substrate-binding protein
MSVGWTHRREFIAGLGGAVACPMVARAQRAATPVIGYLSAVSEAQVKNQVAGFRRGLSETGFVEGQNVEIVWRWADGNYARLPELAGELVRRPVALILAQAPPAALAAKAATATIPTVFVVGFDPVAAGLVESLSRPGGNATGMTLMSAPLGQKRLELLRELAPKATTIAFLVNPVSPDAVPEIRDVQTAARALGLELRMFNAATLPQIDAAFADMAVAHFDGLLVGTDPFFVQRRQEIVARAAHLKVPAVYPFRDYPESGGLISYGANIANSYRQAGIYAGRMLKGSKPADLPVMQPNAFELVINLKAAEASGFEIPPTLHARSDEVIE